jgi:hypothetical protein
MTFPGNAATPLKYYSHRRLETKQRVSNVETEEENSTLKRSWEG